MIRRNGIHIAVADRSVIVRNGMISTLKSLSDFYAETIDISSFDSLNNCMLSHTPNVLIINPCFDLTFNLNEFKRKWSCAKTKYIALLYNVMDTELLKDYDGIINIYDNINRMNDVLSKSLSYQKRSLDFDEQQSLSAREKEVVCCVVKGMTNKEIAESLFLSVHTVITHRRNVARKLQIHSPSGLTIYAIVNKLVKVSDVKIGK
jgi:Response regulator containing a CheY-like receiver domain and an HTH DNA-binding domain